MKRQGFGWGAQSSGLKKTPLVARDVGKQKTSHSRCKFRRV